MVENQSLHVKGSDLEEIVDTRRRGVKELESKGSSEPELPQPDITTIGRWQPIKEVIDELS
jgi:hypothetical protein